MPSWCHGRPCEDCCFSRDGTGEKSRVKAPATHCSFCDKHLMSSMCADNHYRVILKSLHTFDERTCEMAMEYIPLEYHAYFKDKITKHKNCLGIPGQKCVFALSKRGGPAESQGDTCMFCTPQKLASMCATSAGCAKLRINIQKMKPLSQRRIVQNRIPEEHREAFMDLLGASTDIAPQLAVIPEQRRGRKRKAPQSYNDGPLDIESARQRISESKEKWKEPLSWRGSVMAPFSDMQRKILS